MSESSPTRRPGALGRLRRLLKAAVLSGPRRDRWQQPGRVVDALGIERGMRLADIGSGGGYFTMRLARAVGHEGHVYAVDTDADLRSLVADRAAARGLAHVTTVAPPEHDPGLPEPVDLAVIVDAFHHLPDAPAYLQELVDQHLAPDGRVAVLEPVPRWWRLGHATDPALIRVALEDAGLTVEADHDFLGHQSFVVGRRTSRAGRPATERMATDPLEHLLGFPLVEAMYGRRSRRFGLGMEIPSGPLAFRSEARPAPLTELERSVLVAAGTGVTGWHFGVPFGPDRPESHAHYSHRFTGRTAPTAAGFGTPVLFFTDDDGTYLTNTRDCTPDAVREYDEGDGARQILDRCRERTTQLSDQRLDLPAHPPHMLPPNLWMANAPGSTLFMPVGDASEQALGLMAMALANGNLIMDDHAGRPAGDLAPFVRSGLLDDSRRTPLSVLQQMAYEANSAELDFMAHNIVLTMQAMGLGGLFLSGLNRWSVLGAFADDGIAGLGFRFVDDERWTLPDPVGLDGHYEALCPPYQPDMRTAAEVYAERKFGDGGAYDASTPGPWRDTAGVKGGVEPYSDEFVSCLGEVAQYVHDTYGRFPGTFTTMVLTGYVQVVHLDTEYYDTHFRPGAYLPTHREHWARWHAPDAGR